MKTGSIIYASKIKHRAKGMVAEGTLKTGYEAICLVLGHLNVKEDPLPTKEDMELRLADLGYYSGDFLLEVFGAEACKKLGTYMDEKITKAESAFNKRKSKK